MRLCKFLICLSFWYFPIILFAQSPDISTDITGLWKGTLYNDTTKQLYKYEIGISKEKGKFSGFSHTWFLVDDKQYYGVKKVKVNIAKDGKIIVEDEELIANNYPEPPARGVRQLNVLTLDISDSIMKLSGPFSTNRTKNFHSLTGHIQLERKQDFWQSALVPHLQELGIAQNLSFVKDEMIETAAELVRKKDTAFITSNEVIGKKAPAPITYKNQVPDSTLSKVAIASHKAKLPNHAEAKVPGDKTSPARLDDLTNTTINKTDIDSLAISEKPRTSQKLPSLPAADVLKRTTSVQQIVYFNADSLQLSLYDNGEVDGDTVSVLMNGQVLMAKERLSTIAVRKTIYIPAGQDSIELIMYAENLGTIPPNTGLLVVKDGKSIYEIRFSGDLQKNSSIILKRKN